MRGKAQRGLRTGPADRGEVLIDWIPKLRSDLGPSPATQVGAPSPSSSRGSAQIDLLQGVTPQRLTPSGLDGQTNGHCDPALRVGASLATCSRRRQEVGPDPGGWRPPHQGTSCDPARQKSGRLRLRPFFGRWPLAVCLQRDPARRARENLCRLPPSRCRGLGRPRCPDRASHDRLQNPVTTSTNRKPAGPVIYVSFRVQQGVGNLWLQNTAYGPRRPLRLAQLSNPWEADSGCRFAVLSRTRATSSPIWPSRPQLRNSFTGGFVTAGRI